MNDKKNIDRLFQEQLKDFEVHPPEFVWENIREKLEEKKKRRAVPIWFRYSGVAAGLVAGAFFGWQYLSGDDATQKNNPEGSVVLQPIGGETAKPVSPEKVLNPDGVATGGGRKNTLSNNQSTLVSAEGEGDVKTGNAASAKAKPSHKGGSATNTLPVAEGSRALVQQADNAEKSHKQKRSGSAMLPNAGEQVAYDNQAKKSGNTVKSIKDKAKRNNVNVNAVERSFNSDADAVAGVNTAQKRTNLTPSGSAKSRLQSGKSDADMHNNDTTPNTAVVSNTALPVAKQQQSVQNRAGSDDSLETAGNNTNKNGYASQNTTKAQRGSIRVIEPIPVIDKDIELGSLLPGEQKVIAMAIVDTIKPENELEKMLREKEAGDKDKQLADNTAGKWNVKPQVAPVFYNSFSNGSPIDAQFASNSKNYDKDLSVGVGLNYALNNRLSIRSGINTVSLNYATQDIQFYASLEGSTSNVSAKGVRTARNASIVVTTRGEGIADGFSSNAMRDGYNGSMVQTTGYIEVPLEMSYALLRKRFGIQVIGGVSTLFLNQNKVSVVSTQGLATEVGEAQNLNDVHFSTNVGLGFKYRIFKALEANFEPTLKYQVNTYSRDAGNFKPYFIGLYSGISFSF